MFEILKAVTATEPYDWDAIREDEAPSPEVRVQAPFFLLICSQEKVLIPLTKASIMAGGVFERDATSLRDILGVYL